MLDGCYMLLFVIGDNRVLVCGFLMGIVLCAFFWHEGWGVCLVGIGESWSFESWLSIMLCSAWEGWVPGVF